MRAPHVAFPPTPGIQDAVLVLGVDSGGLIMTRRNLTILLCGILSAICWALGYFRHSPLLDALGSVFVIVALLTRLAKKSPAG